MNWVSEGIARMRALRREMFDRSATEGDLDDEIRLHIDLETDKHIRLGHTPGEARRLALVAFGGIEVAKESHRDGRGVRWWHDLTSDARHALRTLVRAPVFAITATLTIGLGIGATTAIFAVVNDVVLQPLAFQAPERLVMLWEENPDKGWKQQTVAPANYFDWREQLKSLESSAAVLLYPNAMTLTGDGEPRQVTRANVTGGFFQTLGVKPLIGRSFREEETWQRSEQVVMLSYELWRDQFNSSPDIVGKRIELSGQNIEVVGVVPQSAKYPGLSPDIWASTSFALDARAQISFRRAHYLRVIGRLRSGVSIEAANSELRALMLRLEQDYPATNVHMTAAMTPLKEFLVGNTSRQLFILLAAVVVLLLIACANVTNLVLVQTAGRQRELAMRLALGASRSRLARQSMTESVVLAFVGGFTGLALGWAGMRAMAALQPVGMLPDGSISMNWGEVVFALALACLAGLLFGVVPSIRNARRAPADVLRAGGRASSHGPGARIWGGGLVVAEVSLAVLLTLGAGLLVKSYWQLQRVDPGFNPNGVITMALSAPGARYNTGEKLINFYGELVDRTRGLPGVEAVAAVSSLPATLEPWSSDFAVAGRPALPSGSQVVHREVSEDYHRVMGIKLVSGRVFTAADRAGAPMVVLINDVLARQYFPNENPVGLRITFDRIPDSTSVWRTIVGVVGSERQASPTMPARPEFTAPFAQMLRNTMTLVVRTTGNPEALAPSMRQTVRELDSSLAIASLRTMHDVRAESVGRERFLTTILLAFAFVGFALALIGVYGVMAQLARGRTREMGIRLALGAPVAGVQWLLVRYGLSLTACGLVIGIAAAVFSTRALKAMLFQVAPLDFATFVSVPILLCLAAAIASWLPARRAARVDPSVTLRSE
ncbi:MAG: ABC transporter permease [Phycisphaerae bacterium]|nr:ABC transporter permease [Gemmatimonadaceae bacterium]